MTMNRIIPYSTLLLLACFASSSFAKGRTVARLFWQDDASAIVRCADLKKSADGWSLSSRTIDGHPKLDDAEQSLVQMRHHDAMVVVGVRDVDDGNIGSGWFAIESGVTEEPHGDHSHWYFKNEPRVCHRLIDQSQGNPAHVYLYGDHFVLANDKRNGFTLATAKQIRQAKTSADASRFLEGGNGHITLAVAPQKVAYATWIAPGGDDCGRVDVIGLGNHAGKTYSIKCPTGMLHGAALVADKAFFAPADGVCWVTVDEDLNDDPESVAVHHLSLGTDDEEKPLRTGAFSRIGNHLVFAVGKDDHSKLCWIDGSSDQPSVSSLPIEVNEGESLTTPVTMTSRYGDTLAVMFGQNKTSPKEDRMLIVDLDPDRNGDFRDASVTKSIDIGPNQIAGHSGYHAVAMLPDRRHLVVTNPGDGTIWVVNLSDHQVTAKLSVEGTPTRVLAIP
jgi:hypothetical protein